MKNFRDFLAEQDYSERERESNLSESKDIKEIRTYEELKQHIAECFSKVFHTKVSEKDVDEISRHGGAHGALTFEIYILGEYYHVICTNKCIVTREYKANLDAKYIQYAISNLKKIQKEMDSLDKELNNSAEFIYLDEI